MPSSEQGVQLDEVVFRHVVEEDFQEWLPLWDAYNAFYGREGETALAPRITALTWSRLLDPAEPMHALVAEAGPRLIGFAHYLFHRSTISIAPTCYLQDLFTLPEARGKGIATALIQRVCDEARKSGSQRVYWQTHESNAKARRLYDRLAERSGFIIYRKSL
jgi:GNAT superfamily N-acetyltransferase